MGNGANRGIANYGIPGNKWSTRSPQGKGAYK